MATKRPIESKELWATFIYALAEFLPQIYEDPMFQEMMSDQMVWIRPLYMMLMIYLRLFSTSKPIYAGSDKPKEEDKKKMNPVEEALQADDDYIKDF